MECGACCIHATCILVSRDLPEDGKRSNNGDDDDIMTPKVLVMAKKTVMMNGVVNRVVPVQKAET